MAGDWDNHFKSRLDAVICVRTGMQEQDSPSIPEGHSEHGQVRDPIQSWESSIEWSACHVTSWPLTHMSSRHIVEKGKMGLDLYCSAQTLEAVCF